MATTDPPAARTDAVLYTISVGRATIDECLKRQGVGQPIRREWLVTVRATLDTARAEIERLRTALPGRALGEGEP